MTGFGFSVDKFSDNWRNTVMADSIMEKVHFTTLSNGGAALGRLADGRVIFVKGILPDELALIRYFKTDSRFVTGELIDILEPSTRRIAPFCPLFGMCSGCQLQFLDYTEQLAEKMKILSDQLLRIGKIENSGEFLQPIIPSPNSSHYRKSIRFFVGEDGSLCLPTLDEKEWLSIRTCPVCTENINQFIPVLSFDRETGIAEAEIREGDEGEIQLILRGEMEKPENEVEVDIPVSIVYSSPANSYVIAGDSTLQQTIAGISVAASDDAPFCSNPDIMEPLCAALSAWIPANDVYNVLNLNCGTGFWSKWFASRCRKVMAQDENEANAEDFVLNLDAFDNVDLYLGKPEEIIPGLKDKVKIVICETGSSGLTKEAISEIDRCKADTVFYIGHDPAIIARDLARFQPYGFAIQQIIPFDNEPNTAKVSALCVLKK
jgi:23S rRNA (uracil1939-C5)-methyltransferase